MEKQKANPDQHKITNAHQHLEDIDNYKITGSIIQSKDKIILEQEKPNKYFFDQEKQKQKLKTIKQLQKNTSTNEMKTNNNRLWKINLLRQTFFSNLYIKAKPNKTIQEELLPIQPKITHEENQKLTQQITLAELKHTVFQMENSKSPGVDGIPIEFYKTHLELIKHDLLDLFNSILFQNEKIPTSMTRAVITLIPKNDKKEFLKNWRPISLLFGDYKILTKIISNRLKLMLD